MNFFLDFKQFDWQNPACVHGASTSTLRGAGGS